MLLTVTVDWIEDARVKLRTDGLAVRLNPARWTVTIVLTAGPAFGVAVTRKSYLPGPANVRGFTEKLDVEVWPGAVLRELWERPTCSRYIVHSPLQGGS